MQQIYDFFGGFETFDWESLLIAIIIFLLFRVLSNWISFGIIKLFKFKEKDHKKVKANPFYKPLIGVLRVLGIYLAILYLKTPLNIDESIMKICDTGFQVLVTIAFARGIAESLTTKSTLVKKIRSKSGKDVEDGMVNLILKIARGIIYVIAGFLVITELGFNLNGLIAGLGIGSVVITLAAQDTAKNLFGGLVILIDRPFLVGDWIAWDTYEGTVEEITFRSTRVRTFENSLVNIPNSVLANSSITNWSKMEKRRYKLNLCLNINTPIEKLDSLKSRISLMLLRHEQILDESIIVKFDQITDNGINVLICTYTDSVDYVSFLNEKEEINKKIMQLVRDEGIELAFDTKTVYVKN